MKAKCTICDTFGDCDASLSHTYDEGCILNKKKDKWALIDVSPVVQHNGEVNHIHTSWSASKVIGIYDSEENACQASYDVYDRSGKQDFRVVNVGMPKHLEPREE